MIVPFAPVWERIGSAMPLYRHKQSGQLYWLLAFAINKTFGLEG